MFCVFTDVDHRQNSRFEDSCAWVPLRMTQADYWIWIDILSYGTGVLNSWKKSATFQVHTMLRALAGNLEYLKPVIVDDDNEDAHLRATSIRSVISEWSIAFALKKHRIFTFHHFSFVFAGASMQMSGNNFVKLRLIVSIYLGKKLAGKMRNVVPIIWMRAKQLCFASTAAALCG